MNSCDAQRAGIGSSTSCEPVGGGSSLEDGWMDDGCAVIVVRFDSELAQALEEAENERDQKDKALQENTALGTEIYTLRRNLQVCVGNPTPPQKSRFTSHFFIQTF